ncbi:protein kinase domain-containing protein [Micromonospora sp. WMMA1923]|uniref:serine/threonine-protein kinase n=1 Tax=Micromonospora sp. WMMA1923 TaxID=3404125 RepID=UPI003B9324DC
MQLLGGRYQLVEPVGEGGMAVVWRAYDRVLRRTVAVKLLVPRLAADQRFRDRVRQEAYAAAQLNHPHIAGVYDYGETRHGRHRRVPYLVLEFVDGGTLADRLRDSGPLDWADTVRIGMDVAAALAAAHVAGLVHRDVKPGNVMLSETGVKVVDLGIAESIGQPAGGGTGEVLGTPRYMAPEQARGEVAVSGSDLYAFGLLLIECLTGRPPAHGSTPTELIRQRQAGIGPELPTVPGLPEPVAELCRRCLAPDPADRPSAVEAFEILAEAAGPRPLTTVTGAAMAGPGADRAPAVPGANRDPAVPGADRDPVAPRRRARAVTNRSSRERTAAATPPRQGRTGRSLRRPMLLGAAPAAVLLAILGTQLPGLGSIDDPTEGTRAEAAPAVPAAGCATRYTAQHDLDGTFVAGLTVTNSGGVTLSGWQLVFSVPDGQRMVDSADDVQLSQEQQSVTVRAAHRLAPGQTTTLSLRGTHDVTDGGAPREFSLNGTPCARAFATVTSASGTTESTPGGSGDTSGIGAADGQPSDERPQPDRTVRTSPLPIPTGSTSPPDDDGSTEPEPIVPSPSAPTGTPSPEPTDSPDPPRPTASPEPDEDDGTPPSSPPVSRDATTPEQAQSWSSAGGSVSTPLR